MGPAFVEAIVTKQDTVALALKRGIADFVASNVPKGSSEQVSRAARRFGIIATSGELAALSGILPWPKGEATSAAAHVFATWLAARGGTHNAEDEEAISRVRGFLQLHGSSRFEPMDRGIGVDGPRIQQRAGYWEFVDGLRQYLILSDVWRNEICAGADQKRVAAVLASRGMLVVGNDGKNSIARNLPDMGKSRVYTITPTIFGGDDA